MPKDEQLVPTSANELLKPESSLDGIAARRMEQHGDRNFQVGEIGNFTQNVSVLVMPSKKQESKAARFQTATITLANARAAHFFLKANALLLFWPTHTGQNRQTGQNRHRPQNARLVFTDAVRAAPCLIMAAPLSGLQLQPIKNK